MQVDVPAQLARKRPRGEKSAQKAHGGAGVAAIDWPQRSPQPVETAALDAELARPGLLHPDAQRSECSLGLAVVLSTGEPAHPHRAIGERRKNHRAMADRFIS